jgi:hypothetical protein
MVKTFENALIWRFYTASIQSRPRSLSVHFIGDLKPARGADLQPVVHSEHLNIEA